MELIIDGHVVSVGTGGRAFDPSLPPVVFLHGAGADHTVWAWHSRWVAHHGHSVLAVDLPGHGRSGGDPLTTVEALADWLARLLAVAGAGPALVVGHSLGALVGLEAAARHPQAVRRLALIGAAAAMPVSADLLDAAATDRPEARDMVSLWGLGARAGLGGSRAPGLWMTGMARALLERARPGVLHADFLACDRYAGGPAAAARVRCPTVLVLGGTSCAALKLAITCKGSAA